MLIKEVLPRRSLLVESRHIEDNRPTSQEKAAYVLKRFK